MANDLSMKLSAWQKSTYTIKPKSTEIISFTQKPNYWRIINGGSADLYLGIANIPRTDSFEMKIPPATSRVYAEEYGRNQIMLYNDGLEAANIILISFKAEFNPLILALVGDSELISNSIKDSTFDGVIKGFTEPLPNGTNTIGKVEITGTAATSISRLANIETKVSNIFNFIEAMSTRQSTTYSYNGEIGTTETNIADFSNESQTKRITQICFITNDGDDDIEVKINNARIILKAGETINNLNCYVSKFSIKAVNTSSKYRTVFNATLIL